MYKLHLILKYLRKRRIAWVSLIAVMLCTAMVLIVISVMGGWLRMFRASFHGLSGDVIVEARSLTGFPHYQEMIDKIEALPEVEAAVPTVQSFGLININNRLRKGVQVIGYQIDQIGDVNSFPQSLHRQWEVEKKKTPSFDLMPSVDYELWAPPGAREAAKRWPGMIVGAGVVGIGKDETGEMWRPEGLYEAWVKLTTLQVSPDTSIIDLSQSSKEQFFWIVDDSRTQVYQYDSSTVYVAFEVLQELLGMQGGQTYVDADTGKEFVEPARTSAIQVKVREGVDLVAARKRIEAVVDAVRVERNISPAFPIGVETWEESQRTWLEAIENEKGLVTMLFGIISLVAVFLILCIFYMIVMEKTKDIGIIKSVGATSTGIAAIFLGYGAAIGIVGAGMGFLLGYGIVSNINYLHEKFAQITGRPIWNPAVYAFDTIPNTMNPNEVVVILAVAVVASVLGAVVPAIAAARMHPVESLRWE